ncbi:hypothetical protein C0J52_27706 [Blattella germanica]|nr:hypothetical protein C0J52_27706 [Blattella germanica]
MLTECLDEEYQEQFCFTTLKEKDYWDVLGKDGLRIFSRPQQSFIRTITDKDDDDNFNIVQQDLCSDKLNIYCSKNYRIKNSINCKFFLNLFSSFVLQN